jgi:RNA polymerase sigma-70 factor (ECF subfamily)
VDDLALVERARQGDEAAFAELFGRHRPAVRRYAVHLCGASAADDVVQDVFLALIGQLQRFDARRGTLQSYLLGIARHQVLRRLGRHEWPLADEEVELAAGRRSGPADGNPLDALSLSETIERVRAAVRALPPAYREVVVLCELNELDYAAASNVIGCPVGTVRSRLHRARALLTAKLTAMNPGVLTI